MLTNGSLHSYCMQGQPIWPENSSIIVLLINRSKQQIIFDLHSYKKSYKINRTITSNNNTMGLLLIFMYIVRVLQEHIGTNLMILQYISTSRYKSYHYSNIKVTTIPNSINCSYDYSCCSLQNFLIAIELHVHWRLCPRVVYHGD